MITINEIKIDDSKYLTGKIGKDVYSVEYNDDIKQELVEALEEFNAADDFKAAQAVLKAIAKKIKKTKKNESKELEEVLAGDLYFNKKANTYHIKADKKVSDTPVAKFFVDKMIEANDKGLSPKPWLIFWVRLMRNSLYAGNQTKIDNIIAYLEAQYVDKENVTKLIEEGYAEKMATKLSTFDQISITEQGILAAFKYVSLIDTKFIVVKNKETGEQEIKNVAKYEKSEMEVDEVTGKVTKEAELILPEAAEDFSFLPPIMGNSGDAFTCKDIDDASEEPALGHVIKVGKIHELAKGFTQVDTNDAYVGRAGLHLGGYYYVEGFSGRTNYLVDCLIAPEDVGAVCDLSRHEEGAIRCRRYMVTGGHFAVSQGMYHPSTYAELLDLEWENAKKEAIAKLNKEAKKIAAQQ